MQLDVVRVSVASEMAIGLLDRYFKELNAQFEGGFQREPGGAAPEAEFIPPDGAFLVAYLDGSPVGCVGLRKLDDSTAEVKRMWIDPAARGRGYGRSLLSALEETARDLDYRVARLDTSADLTQALGLYRSAGYREIPAYNDNPYAAVWLEKPLT